MPAAVDDTPFLYQAFPFPSDSLSQSIQPLDLGSERLASVRSCSEPKIGHGCRFFIFWLILLLIHQMSVGLFRLAGWVGRTLVAATTLGCLVLFFVIVLGGFVLAKRTPTLLPHQLSKMSFPPNYLDHVLVCSVSRI